MTFPVGHVLFDDPTAYLWAKTSPQDLAIISAFWGEKPVPIGKIAAALGLVVQTDSLDVNISGHIKKVSDAPTRFEITVNVADVAVRQRFTVAHEIGHYVLHKGLIDKEGIVDTILFRSKLSNANEVEANKLAASMLLPWNTVRTWTQTELNCLPNAETISVIAKAFKVSELTVGFRFGF